MRRSLRHATSIGCAGKNVHVKRAGGLELVGTRKAQNDGNFNLFKKNEKVAGRDLIGPRRGAKDGCRCLGDFLA